jgi:hypothetical protein
MIALEYATEKGIRATGERLFQRQKGIQVPLQNEIWLPTLIKPAS